MCFVFICLNSRIILIVWEKSFWNFLLRWQLILFKNYCHFYNIWVDYLVPLQIHLCGSRCSAHLSSTLLWFWEEWAVAYRKPCKTPIHTGAGWRAPRNSSHSLLCSRVPFKISVKKKKIIYLPTDPVIWFIGSASVSFKGHSFYLPQLGQLLCMSLDVVGLLRLYKPWAAKQRLNAALCSLIRINGTRLPSALQ